MRSAADAQPEAALAAAGHALGDVDASVVLLEYGDYECPHCIATEPLVQGLIAATNQLLAALPPAPHRPGLADTPRRAMA